MGVGGLSGMCPLEFVHAILAFACWRLTTKSYPLRRGNMGTQHSCKEQARSRTNKDGKEYMLKYQGHRRD